jgi:hypothetical protein
MKTLIEDSDGIGDIINDKLSILHAALWGATELLSKYESNNHAINHGLFKAYEELEDVIDQIFGGGNIDLKDFRDLAARIANRRSPETKEAL